MIRRPLHRRPRIGIALGSGSARGWAHIGVLRGLEELGIVPDVVCGSSIGSLVGGAYVSGRLDAFEDWIRSLDWKGILRYLDIRLLAGGGFIEGKRLMDFLRDHIGDVEIEELSRPFATLATDLATGREVWLRDGSLLEAVRASIALPGFFTPVRRGDAWMVDGGLVNPVPVSLCRALGAEVVIAVNLNGDIVGRHIARYTAEREEKREGALRHVEATLLERLSNGFANLLPTPQGPGIFEVMAASINIMQDRITRSRMAGDPPDVLLAPRLAQIALMDYDRSSETIEAGYHCVLRHREFLEPLVR